MLLLRPPRTKRFMALVLTSCLCLAAVEAPIADVHDGGATHAELDQVTGASHADHGGEIDRRIPEGTTPGPSDHPVHVCHCTHAHFGVLAASRVDLPDWEHPVRLMPAIAIIPRTIAIAPPTPPPTA